MAKRAPIVDESFNPVASQIERYKRSTSAPPQEDVVAAKAEAEPAVAEEPSSDAPTTAAEPKVARRAITPKREVPRANAPKPLTRALPPEPEPAPNEPEPEPEPVAPILEAMNSSLRARVTETEREHYTALAYWLTGKQNQFSSVARALLLLLEHAQEQGELEKRLEDIHGLERPSPKDRLGMALYEYRLAEAFWESIEAAGRPQRG